MSPKDLAEWIGKEALALFVGVVCEDGFKQVTVLIEVDCLASFQSELVSRIRAARNLAVKHEHKEADVCHRHELQGSVYFVQEGLGFDP